MPAFKPRINGASAQVWLSRRRQISNFLLQSRPRERRASPKTGERCSLRKISAELAAAGYLNERGRPFNPNSVKLMLEG